MNNLGVYEDNANLTNKSTLHTSSFALGLYFPNNIQSLKVFLKYVKALCYKYIIIGYGSNILFANNFINKIVINLSRFRTLKKVNIDNELCEEYDYYYVESGIALNKVVFELSKFCYEDIYKLAGIPGSIGGALYMNAGCNNVTIYDYVYSVTYLDEELLEHTINDFNVNYRSTSFKDSNNIILSCILKLSKNSDINTTELYNYYKRKKMSKHPLSINSAGSTFKNSVLPAWFLIKTSVDNSISVNDAYIYENHSNIIVNKKNSTYKDILLLIVLIELCVYIKHHIWLELEYCIIK